MPFRNIDAAAISRALSRIADRPADVADAFFERIEVITLTDGQSPSATSAHREQGLALRLVRDRQSWQASSDRIDRDTFVSSLRVVARAQPPLTQSLPQFDVEHWDGPPTADELSAFPAALEEALARRGVTAPFELELKRFQRWVRVVGTRFSSLTEHERFYGLRIRLGGAHYGTLLANLSSSLELSAEHVAGVLSDDLEAREAESPTASRYDCVLGPAATAVLLHEGVAHALEADTLIVEGPAEAALGASFGNRLLDVFDDPRTAPSSVQRHADDEGYPTFRRCLLRAGVVEQVLADGASSRLEERLSAGAGRRSDRHMAPVPRSHHLELVAGTTSRNQLLDGAKHGLYLPRAERGQLDPLTGVLELRFPGGRWIRNGTLGDSCGPCRLRGRAADVLQQVVAVGAETRVAGSGWCLKAGVRLPVWATVPAIGLRGVEIR